MEAKDLRLGNWILEDDGILCKITGFTPFDHSTRCDEEEGCLLLIDLYQADGSISKGWECDSNEVKPIELSEEWLLKFGFEKKQIREDLKHKMGDYAYLHPDIKFYSLIEDKDGYMLSKFETYICDIKYVHEFQNVIFALTGEELTINEGK
jgi:hypothetical protein